MDLGYLAAAAVFMVYAAPGALSTAVYLAAVSAFDLRSREVPVWALVSFAPAAAYLAYRLASEAAALGLAYAALLTYIPFLVILPAAALMARRGVLGYGDLFILSAVLLLDNYYISTPTPLGFVHANLIVIACSSLVALARGLVFAAHNLRRYGLFSQATRGYGAAYRLYLLLSGRAMAPEEFARASKYYRPGEDVNRASLSGGQAEGPVVAVYAHPLAAYLLIAQLALIAYMLVNPSCISRIPIAVQPRP